MESNHESLPQLLTIKEVALILNCSIPSIRRYVQSRTIPFYKIGGAIRFSQTEMEQYIAQQRVSASREW
ncbi:MAG: helix-turn-helix domain-containing protein [Patescibacteria group bacterium]